MRKKLGCIAAASILILLLSAYSISSITRMRKQEPKSGGTFKLISLANVSRLELDPANPYSFIFLSEQIYDGLVRLNKNLRIEPSLAEYWEISSDGTVYTFFLRKGVRFHDGIELRASDVKFSLERLLDKQTESPHYQYFVTRVEGAQDFRDGRAEGVSGYRVLDEYTFQIKWSRPYVPALYLMSMHFCKILPRERVISSGQNFWLRPAGTGPFIFDYWIRTNRLEIAGVRLKRNDNYFDGQPYLDGIEFGTHFFTLDDFYNEEIDSIPVLTNRLLNSEYQIFQDGALTHYYLGMSCHIFPLDRPAVRKAIALGLDKEALVQASADVRYLRKVTNNYIPSRLRNFYPFPGNEGLDQEQSREMLLAEGFFQDIEFPTLTIYFEPPRDALKNRIFREIRDQLNTLGISSRMDFYESPESLFRVGGPYLVFHSRMLSIPDPEDMIIPLFHSQSMDNVFGYENSEIDGLIKDVEVERSMKKRNQLFHKIEKILLQDIPAIPLFSHQNRVAMQPYVRGVVVPALGFYYIDATKIWLDR